MKREFIRFLFIIFFIFHLISINADEPYCSNLGFELRDFTNWKAYTWVDKQDGTLTSKILGVADGRHTIITTNSYDYTVDGENLRLIPNGFTTSVKLGSTYLGGGGLHQSLTYQIDVTPENAFVIYRFAVVLLDPQNDTHEKIDEPRFKVTLLKQNGDIINDCANYDVYASEARIGGWQQSVNNSKLFWRDWTAVGINLSNYIGQTITLEFMSANCRRSGHYGYAYFVAECHPFNITVDYCAGSNDASLTAPVGFESYNWTDSLGNTVGTDRNLLRKNPLEGDTYSCNMLSATGCEVSLKSTIYRFEPNAVFKNDLIDCNKLNNTLHFYITNPPTHGTLKFKWDFGDGTTSTEAEPMHSFESVSGWVPVSLVVENPPSTCKDSFTKNVEIFNPPLIKISGDTTYCPGETVTLKSYGADHYKWKINGVEISTSDSIIVGAPGGLVELTGFTSNNECSASKYKTVIEEPYWPFTSTPDTTFCAGDNLTLTARGANSYRWSSDMKPDSVLSVNSTLLVEKSGNYLVTGTNPNGCEKTLKIVVTKDEIPKAEFTASPLIINSRHNEVTCEIPQESGVNYFWNFGDNDDYVITGNHPTYKYENLSSVGQQTITLLAVNENGCTKTDTVQIVIEPFFPNVFTPNNDEINDLFLRGMQIQVMDRNGIVVYEGIEGWNGKLHNTGKYLTPDTYFYYATYADNQQKTQIHKGYVTLIRTKQ